MKRIILRKYRKIFSFLMMVCCLILGMFIYPLPAYTDAGSVTLTVNWLGATQNKTIGFFDISQLNRWRCETIGIYEGSSLIEPIISGDLVTIGTFKLYTDCSKKINRLAVLYHGRVKKDLTCQIAPDLLSATCVTSASAIQARIRVSTDDQSAKAIGISLLGSPPSGLVVPTGLCIQIFPNQETVIYTFPVNLKIRVRAYQDILSCKKPIPNRAITFTIKDSQTNKDCLVTLNKLNKASTDC